MEEKFSQAMEEKFSQAADIGSKILKSSEYCHDNDRRRMIDVYLKSNHPSEAFELSFHIVTLSPNVIDKDRLIFLKLFDRTFITMN